MSSLSRELLELQQSQAEFGAALEAVGTRGELLDVKRRLESHQALLTQWEEDVARQLEVISELQSPTKRNSMMAVSAAAAATSARDSLRLSRAVSLANSAGGGGERVGAAAPVANSTAAAGEPAAGNMRSSGFGSSFSSASFAGGLGGGGWAAASAPNSPALWDKARGSGVPMQRRSAFTPGPALTGMGDASPASGGTPR
jgi:hypothetical protein